MIPIQTYIVILTVTTIQRSLTTREQQSDRDDKVYLASILKAPMTECSDAREYMGEELGYKTRHLNSLGSY